MINCERCGKPAYESRRLLGGVHVRLCNSCLTEWDGVAFESEPFLTMRTLDTRDRCLEWSAIAGVPPDKDDMLSIHLERMAADREMRAMATEFVKPLKPE